MSRTTFPALVLSFAALLPSQAPTAAAVRQVEDALPASTYACMRFGGLDACKGVVAQLHAAALVRTFLRQIPAATYEQHIGRELDRAADELRQQLGAAGISPSTLRAVLGRPMALGVGRLTVRGMGLSMALVVDEGPAGAEVDKLVTALTQIVQGRFPGIEPGTARIGELEVRTLANEQGLTVLLARSQGLFVLTNSEGYLREILATASGRQPSLTKASVFGAQRDRLPAPPLAATFVHTARLLSGAGDHLPYEASEFGDALGVRSLDGVFAAVGSPAAGGTAETLDVALAGPANGLLKALFAGPADFGAAALCSSEAVLFGSLHVDVPAAVRAYTAFVALLPRSVQEHMSESLHHDLSRSLGQSGITPQQLDELLHALGGSVSFALNMGKGAVPIPELLVFVPVRDPQVVTPWLERLLAASAEEGHIEWKTREAGGHEIHCCTIDAGGVSLSPSFVLADGYLIASTHTLNVVRALKQHEDPSNSLAAAPDFAAAARECAGAAGFVHLRGFRAAELGWRPFESWVLPKLEEHAEELGFGREAIPDQEEFAKALGTTTWSFGVDEAGVRLRAQGTLGLGGLLAGFGYVFDELLQRASGKVF